MCGNSSLAKRRCPPEEIKYLDALVRGVYAKRNLKKGERLSEEKLYLAIPLQKGQFSCREVMSGQILLANVEKDSPIMVEAVDSPYAHDVELNAYIKKRGI